MMLYLGYCNVFNKFLITSGTLQGIILCSFETKNKQRQSRESTGGLKYQSYHWPMAKTYIPKENGFQRRHLLHQQY